MTAGDGIRRDPATGLLHRSTSRVLIADPTGAVLLFRSYGTDHAVAPRWITPGGGVDPGETFAVAARRELLEETGLDVDPGSAFLEVRFDVDPTWHPYDVGTWAWFVVRAQRFAPSDAGWMPDEREDILEHHWWTADELRATDDAFETRDLPDLIDRALAVLARQRS